ncbi:Uncharacterised protein [Mycobacterium tuberculosis]|nr:Uncharacterised protein [Mycobacterium tuberculosis]CFC66167.1 Uncharacterised protein [Mycobacterium tuberculosis]CFS32253.1 Uncharacterised protein [Mycobacterium tuberculosis]CKL97330.1 Uncharacterised protein [Mycobacterium tuberculosis]CKN61246.1 Uncharacterised protein [Mycobacterium tuberculosis]
MLSRLHVAGGQRGRGQRRVAHTREVLAQLGGLESGVGRRPSRTQFTLVGEREGQALQAVGLVQHFLRRLGLVHHLAELGGGRGQLPPHQLGVAETPAAPQRIGVVTDRGSQLACLLGGRACRDRVTRHDRIDRLKGKDLGQPPPVVYRSCQVDRLGEIRRGRIGASYRYRDQAAGRERPGQQRRFIDLARDHQSLLGLLHTGGGVDEDVEQGLVGQCPGAHRGRHLEMTRILVGKNAVKPGAPLLDAPPRHPYPQQGGRQRQGALGVGIFPVPHKGGT